MKAGWTELSFDDAVEDCSSGNPKILQSEFSASGRYPIIDQGQDLIAGYTSDSDLLCRSELPVIVFGDHTRCFKFVDFPFCLGADGVKVLRPRIDCDTRYLFHYLCSLNLPNAGYSRHFKFLKRERVLLPKMEEQRRIAAILDMADALRQKRRLALQKLDSLTQSIFLDMFGDPGRNPKRLRQEPLDGFLSFVTSGARGWAEYYASTGTRFIRSLDVQMNHIPDADPAYVVAPDNAEARRTRVKAGDVLLTITGSRIGRVSPVPPELEGAFISQHVAILRLDVGKLHPEFLAYFLSLDAGGQRQIASAQYGQTKPGLNFEQIRRFMVPVPTITEQWEFVRRVHCARRIGTLMGHNSISPDRLFASLQQCAFGGDL